MKQLVWMKGQEVVKRFPLHKEHYSIGRSKENDLVFDHVKVSRNHARLYKENGDYVIQDLNSTNYIFVNGFRVKQKKLEINDRLQISSEIELLFVEENTPPAPADKSQTMMDIQKHFIHKDDLMRLKKVTQSVVLLNSLDTILMQILKEGISLTGAERGLIVLTDSQGQILWKYATTYRIDRDKAESGQADISQSILQEAINSRETVVRLNENSKDAPPPSDSMMSLKIFSAMCAPLILEERVIGLFYVDARQIMNNFTEVDQFLFDYLADHAAIAIFNAKRYADLENKHQKLKQSMDELDRSYQELEARHHKLRAQSGHVQAEADPGKPADESLSHTYSAGGVVINPKGEVLMVSQKGLSWSLPKGQIEIGEEPAITAQREIFEEAGISYMHLVQSLGSYQRSALNAQGQPNPMEMKTIYMYLFTTEQMVLQPQDPANPEARWASPDQILQQLTHPVDKEFFQGILPDIQANIAAKKIRSRRQATPPLEA